MPGSAAAAVTALLGTLSTQPGRFEVHCVEGCLVGAGDETPDLLYRVDEDADLVLLWVTGAASSDADRNRVHRVLAGNPRNVAQLPDRGVMTPAAERPDLLTMTVRVPGREVGTGSFIGAVVDETKGGGLREIVDWRAMRLLTPDELHAERTPPQPSSRWELDLTPWAMRADTPSGVLPRSRSKATTWWSLAHEGSWTNLDLDGDSNGTPGLAIQVTQPWAAGDGAGVDDSGWKDDITDRLKGGVAGRIVRFEGMTWTEQPDRVVDLGDPGEGREIKLVSYYLPVTLYTRADVQPLEVSSLGRPGRRTVWAHETSADLKGPNHPRLWAGYSVRDFSQDPDLLKLLGKQVRQGKAPPGLPHFNTNDGDGGAAQFQVAFHLAMSPWMPSEQDDVVDSGIVAIDVVAARRGIGAPLTRGSAGGGALDEIVTKVVGPGDEAKSIDLDAPPKGYFVSEAFAKLGTTIGTVRLLEGGITTAQRGVYDGPPEAEDLAVFDPDAGVIGGSDEAAAMAAVSGEGPEFPDAVRFVLAADLRAGALMQEGIGFTPRLHPRRVVPVDAFAQYILKVTIAMKFDTQLVTNSEALIVSEKELAAEINVVEKPPSLAQRIAESIGVPPWILIGVGLALLLLLLLGFVPGLRQLLGSVLKLGAGAVDRAAAVAKPTGEAGRGASAAPAPTAPGVEVQYEAPEGVVITVRGRVPRAIRADITISEVDAEEDTLS